MSAVKLSDNHFEAVDHGDCKNVCFYYRPVTSPVNAQGICEDCYYSDKRQCCVPGCANLMHVAGEDACSLHELEAARQEGDETRIALWTAYVASDATLPKVEHPVKSAPVFSEAWMRAVLGFTA